MEDKKVKVWNRSIGGISYKIESLRISRSWEKKGDMIEVPMEELKELQYIPGGKKLMEKYMLIKDKDVCEELGMSLDPEYFYDEKDVKELLLNGTYEQLLDCLEFAPAGVLDQVRDLTITLPLDSAKKRQAISKALKIDIDSAIRNYKDSKDDGKEDEAVQGRQRRADPISTEKVEEKSKYNVVHRN